MVVGECHLNVYIPTIVVDPISERDQVISCNILQCGQVLRLSVANWWDRFEVVKFVGEIKVPFTEAESSECPA